MKIASRWFHCTDKLQHICDADKFVVPKSLGSYVRMVLSSNPNRNAVHAKLILVFNIAYKRLARKSQSRQNPLPTRSLTTLHW
jgi:hypothetical protein